MMVGHQTDFLANIRKELGKVRIPGGRLQKVRGIRHQRKAVFMGVERKSSVFNLNIVAEQPVTTGPTLKLRRVESLLLLYYILVIITLQ